jgi:CubicO group peptidase (beta-lactamase class C family)
VNRPLSESIDAIAKETDFSGAVHVARQGRLLYGRAWGLADRAHGIANTLDTQFGIASGTKGFTTLAVMSLVSDRTLALSTPVRSILGDELELIDRAVTVSHLLTHTSGIGDYLDESTLSDVDDYVMPVPVHQLARTVDYLPVLRGHPMKFSPGTRFEYCNGGFVVLALVIEAVTGSTYHDVVAERVFLPAGMAATAFLRSDQLPGSAAIGYVEDLNGWRTNHFHLPIRGSGDGGTFSTVGDISAFWKSLFAGKIVPFPVVREMTRPHNDVSSEWRYGAGFWLRPDRNTVMLEGSDAGVSFRTAYDPPSELLYTVMANTSAGAWPIVEMLDEMLPELARPLSAR